MGTAIAGQSPLKCLSVETLPRGSPHQRCTPQCCAVLRPLYCSVASLLLCSPKTACDCYWHCWSQSRKDTKTLCCECMGGNLHSERAEGWHQNMHLMLDIKMCDTQLVWPGTEIPEEGIAEEGRAGGQEQNRRWHNRTVTLPWPGVSRQSDERWS